MTGEPYPAHEPQEASGRQSEEPGGGASSMPYMSDIELEPLDQLAMSEEVEINGVVTRVFYGPIGISEPDQETTAFFEEMRELAESVRAQKPRIAELIEQAKAEAANRESTSSS